MAPADYESKRTRVEISDTKPEQSLAEVYEAEYQKQKSAEAGETTKQEPKKEHLEIDQLMTALFAKLDALTNWHFVPKPRVGCPETGAARVVRREKDSARPQDCR